MHPDDASLLRRYAEERSEEAFAELVRRHVNLVYSAALRRVDGDAHRAADVAQAVFIALAHDAAALSQHRVLTGWLYTATRNAALNALRAERRRRTHEQEATIMHELTGSAGTAEDWDKLRPVLDRAMDELGDADRSAVLLRFFEQRSFAEIGATLDVSEDAARMRTERALDKLRARLARHGITSAAAALAAALAGQSVSAAPAGLAGSIAGAVGGSALAASGAATGILTFMNTSHLSAGISVLAAAVAIGTAWWQHDAENSAEAALRAERAQTKAVNARLTDLQGRMTAAAEEMAVLQRQANAAVSRLRPASPAGAATRTFRGQDAVEAGHEFLAAHPEMAETIEGLKGWAFEQNWGDVLLGMKLPPAERARLRRESLRSATFHVMDPAGSFGFSPGADSETLQAGLLELVGAERRAEFIEAYALKRVQTLAKSVAAVSHSAGAPLISGQVEDLTVALLANGARRRMYAPGSGPPGGSTVDFVPVDWAAVTRDLQKTWSAPQLAALEAARKNIAASEQLQNTMRRYPVAPPMPRPAASK